MEGVWEMRGGGEEGEGGKVGRERERERAVLVKGVPVRYNHCW